MPVGHEPAVLRVEADVAGVGERVLDDAFGDLVDGQRGVPAGSTPHALACALVAEQGRHGLPYPSRDLEGQRFRVGHEAATWCSMAVS